MSAHGLPCWFELETRDLNAAGAFYKAVLGWTLTGAGMPDFDYRLAGCDGTMVAGMMSNATQEGEPLPNWIFYLAVDDCDATAQAAGTAGGKVVMPAHDIPGTGRFAVLADPQGAVFGILQPLPMETGPEIGAFDQTRPGHGNWLELRTSDPEAAFDFYAGLFGWTKDSAVEMGAMGTYQIFAHGGRAIGGMMRADPSDLPPWLVYFGADELDGAVQRIGIADGTVIHGPSEVPGGAFIAIARDPQGAAFAVAGPRR